MTMQDLLLAWRGDLSAGPSGDVATADGAAAGQQRVLRRLLTNPGDYIWQPDYGAGLGRYIGMPANAADIAATIRSQIFMEASVARSPEPVIDVQSGDDGAVYVQIQYADATGGEQTLSFSMGA